MDAIIEVAFATGFCRSRQSFGRTTAAHRYKRISRIEPDTDYAGSVRGTVQAMADFSLFMRPIKHSKTNKLANGVIMKRMTLSIVVLIALTAAEAAPYRWYRATRLRRLRTKCRPTVRSVSLVGFGPDVVGGRPREYLNPQAQVLQVQKRLPPGTVNHPFRKLFHRAN